MKHTTFVLAAACALAGSAALAHAVEVQLHDIGGANVILQLGAGVSVEARNVAMRNPTVVVDRVVVRPNNDWRYRYYNNHWWYWTPSNRWLFWYGNAWHPYNVGTYYTYYPRVRTYSYASPSRYYYGGYYQPYSYSTGYRGSYYTRDYNNNVYRGGGYYGRGYRW